MYTIYIFFTYLWTSGFDVKYQMYILHNDCAIYVMLLPLRGVGGVTYTQGVALGYVLIGLSARIIDF